MLRTVFCTLVGLVVSAQLYGQPICGNWDINLVVGANLGATSPVPIPNALHVTRYNPRLNPKVGADVTYFFDDNWGIGTGLRMEWKGMKIHAEVSDVHLTVNVPNTGTLTGYVTGKNETRVNTLYLVQPVYAVYRFKNPRWQLRAGAYLAETLNRNFSGSVSEVIIQVESPLHQERDIPYATLDYSEDARKFDIGLLVGGEFRLNPYIGFFADFTWGFTPYFTRSVPIHFTMRNVYFSLGATIRFW